MQNNTFFKHSNPNNIFVFEELSSTNDYLKELLSKVKPLEPYTVIMTKNQTAGKGQRGNVWKTESDQNLTASFLLCPKNLPLFKQFLLTIVSSLAVFDTIKDLLPTKNIHIKWPNDILIENKKVAGILIENKISKNNIKHSIVGIGINVKQQNFPQEIAYKATSLFLMDSYHQFDILYIAKCIQDRLKYYVELMKDNEDKLLNLYNSFLFNRERERAYLFENREVKGIIKKVEIDGLLQIEIANKLHKVDLKGITYLF